MNGRFFSNFFGIGMIADASENINSTLKEKVGRLSYILSTIKTMASADPFPFTLEHDGGRLDGEAVLIYAANGQFLATKPLPLAEDAMTDGLLEVAVIRAAGLPLVKELLKLKSLDQWEYKDDNIELIRTARLRLVTPKPMRADTDGEVYMETPAEVSVLPRKLTFLVGEEDFGG